ncbi:thioredoxin domain-containing protein [Burkholderia cenocepacia]|uniref:thioredoxin domain-containing protein n=1 Tax=Burkholderia cenocepacia TaxID=95486 RepID=UPI000761EE4A|nr:thioredoxin domain-containing protein [Burkholderia cenocepacia]KWU17809.1 hypothetical protein AS149_13900 [Burkholderia cenocepacia]
MNRIRRHVVKGLVGLAVAAAVIPALAAPAQKHTVDVVKIMAFSCPFCRAAEAQDKVIEDLVTSKGGRFVWAPLPTEASESGAKERVYYASRKVSRALSDKVKDAFYKGTQDQNVQLTEMPQVYAWLQTQLGDLTDAQLQSLFDAAQSDDAKRSLGRAAQIAVAAGANVTPTYVIFVDGKSVTSLDPNTVSGGSLSALRDAVIDRVNQYTK